MAAKKNKKKLTVREKLLQSKNSLPAQEVEMVLEDGTSLTLYVHRPSAAEYKTIMNEALDPIKGSIDFVIAYGWAMLLLVRDVEGELVFEQADLKEYLNAQHGGDLFELGEIAFTLGCGKVEKEAKK